MRLQAIPDLDGDILGGRNGAVERRHLVIQKPVIERLDHFALQNLLQYFEIQNHAGDRIGVAFDGHFQHVVVAVAVRIGGVAEQRPDSPRPAARGCGKRAKPKIRPYG